jgi:hypothetical protein
MLLKKSRMFYFKLQIENERFPVVILLLDYLFLNDNDSG